jgi:hypothetical protein
MYGGTKKYPGVGRVWSIAVRWRDDRDPLPRYPRSIDGPDMARMQGDIFSIQHNPFTIDNIYEYTQSILIKYHRQYINKIV